MMDELITLYKPFENISLEDKFDGVAKVAALSDEKIRGIIERNTSDISSYLPKRREKRTR